jgi:hypothetical protein
MSPWPCAGVSHTRIRLGSNLLLQFVTNEFCTYSLEPNITPFRSKLFIVLGFRYIIFFFYIHLDICYVYIY